MILPCATGASVCRGCQVDMPWHWSGLCECCQKDELFCTKCGADLDEYMAVRLCIPCYRETRFNYKLVPKRRPYGTVAK